MSHGDLKFDEPQQLLKTSDEDKAFVREPPSGAAGPSTVRKSHGRHIGEKRRGANAPADSTERAIICHMLDKAEAEQLERRRNKQIKRASQENLTYEKIAAHVGRCPNFIAKIKRERDRQKCSRVQDTDGYVRTIDVPKPGRQGGFRWCRMNEEQKRMCTRIAIENPRLSVSNIRQRMIDIYPELTLSDSTVWRALSASNMQVLRAKMKDPRAQGNAAQQAEMESFLTEQKKGLAGELGALDLFFMDETTVELNLTVTRAWGTSERPAVIRHEKGKTETISLYAGIGLVSETFEDAVWAKMAGTSTCPKNITDPRGNDFQYKNGVWTRASHPPRFAVFWWLRPPKRAETVLSRFLDERDIRSGHFNVMPLEEKEFSEDLEYFIGKEPTTIKLDPEKLPGIVLQFIATDFKRIKDDEILAFVTWMHGIEWRQTDEVTGDLISMTTKNKQPTKVYKTRETMLQHLEDLKTLVVHSLREYLEDEAKVSEILKLPKHSLIPRTYYDQYARNKLGGRIESERGDQTLFLRFLLERQKYLKNAFPESVLTNWRDAWDSAAQHGKTDLTTNTKSFIHDWVVKELKTKGAIFLPVREPDFNPVELLFGFVKGVIRRDFPAHLGQVSVEEMVGLIDKAFSEVTEDMVKGWLRYGCYLIPGETNNALKENPRCGYDDAVTGIEDIWLKLVERWEKHNGIQLPATVRGKMMQKDPDAIHEIAARYRTVADIDADAEWVAHWAPQKSRPRVNAFEPDLLRPSTVAQCLHWETSDASGDTYDNLEDLQEQLEQAYAESPSKIVVRKGSSVALPDAASVTFEAGKGIQVTHDGNKVFLKPCLIKERDGRTYETTVFPNVHSKGFVPGALSLEDRYTYATLQPDGDKKALLILPGRDPISVNAKVTRTVHVYITSVCPKLDGMVKVKSAYSEITFNNPHIAKVNNRIPLAHTIEIVHSQNRREMWSDNYKTQGYRELDAIAKLLHDTSGMSILFEYAATLPLPDITKSSVDRLRAISEGHEGLLYNMTRSGDLARSHVQEIRERLWNADSIDDVDVLLDVQERIFDPRRDINKPVKICKSESGAYIRLEFDSDPKSQTRCIPKDVTVRSVDSTKVVLGTYTVIDVDSKSFKLSSQIRAGNIQLYKGMNIEFEKEHSTALRRLLQKTPYGIQLVADEDDDTLATLQLATIALKAEQTELERMRALTKSCAQRFLEAMKQDGSNTSKFFISIGRIVDDALMRWHRRCGPNDECVASDGARIDDENGYDLNANNLPPVFVISHLRAERRAAINLKLLARGQPDERRWPGYPVEERDTRNGKPIRTVDPRRDRGIFSTKLVRDIRIKQTLVHKKKTYFVATLVFEDGTEEELIPSVKTNAKYEQFKDQFKKSNPKKFAFDNLKIAILPLPYDAKTELEEIDLITGTGSSYYDLNVYGYEGRFATLFDGLSEQNKVLFEQAKQRYTENEAKIQAQEKLKVDAKKKLPNSSEAIIGTFDGILLRFYDRPKFINYNTDKIILLYDADLQVMHPALDKTINDYRVGNQVVVGLFDKRILERSALSDYWCSLPNEDVSINEILEVEKRNDGTHAFKDEKYTFESSPQKPYRLTYTVREKNKPNQPKFSIVPTFRRLTKGPITLTQAMIDKIKPYSLSFQLAMCKIYPVANTRAYRVDISTDSLSGITVTDPIPKELVEKNNRTGTKVIFGTVQLTGFPEKLKVVGPTFPINSLLLPRRVIHDVYKNKSLLEIEDKICSCVPHGDGPAAFANTIRLLIMYSQPNIEVGDDAVTFL